MKTYLAYALMGLAMGAVLQRIGFADYDEVHRMFVFSDFRLLFTFALAVGFSAVVFLALRAMTGMRYDTKPYHPGVIPGSLTFGFGWAICGACPAIVFVQLGEGKIAALATLAGILLGVRLYRILHARYLQWDTGSCGI